MRSYSFLSSLCLRGTGCLDQQSLQSAGVRTAWTPVKLAYWASSEGAGSVVLGEGLRPGISKTFLVLLLLFLRGGHVEISGLRCGLLLLNSLKMLI